MTDRDEVKMLIVITHLHLCFHIGFAGIHGEYHEEVARCFSLIPSAIISDAVNNNRDFCTPDVQPILFVYFLRGCSQLCQQQQADG